MTFFLRRIKHIQLEDISRFWFYIWPSKFYFTVRLWTFHPAGADPLACWYANYWKVCTHFLYSWAFLLFELVLKLSTDMTCTNWKVLIRAAKVIPSILLLLLLLLPYKKNLPNQKWSHSQNRFYFFLSYNNIKKYIYTFNQCLIFLTRTRSRISRIVV